VARHAERLGLPQHDPATALALTDKRATPAAGDKRIALSSMDLVDRRYHPTSRREGTCRARAAAGDQTCLRHRKAAHLPGDLPSAVGDVLDSLFDDPTVQLGSEPYLTEDFIAEQMWQGAPRPGHPAKSFVLVMMGFAGRGWRGSGLVCT